MPLSTEMVFPPISTVSCSSLLFLTGSHATTVPTFMQTFAKSSMVICSGCSSAGAGAASFFCSSIISSILGFISSNFMRANSVCG